MTGQDTEISYSAPPDEATAADECVTAEMDEQGERYFTDFAARFEAERKAFRKRDEATASG